MAREIISTGFGNNACPAIVSAARRDDGSIKAECRNHRTFLIFDSMGK